MPSHRDPASEVRVPLHEDGVETVHLLSHRVHDGLTVGGAVVEEDVQQRLVGEVPETAGARQRDLLDPPGGQKVLDQRTLEVQKSPSHSFNNKQL